jgi:Uncharacterized conserved protein
VPTGAFPYAALATRDGRKVYVSNWAGRLPQAGDATDGSNPVVVDPATGIANNGTVSVYDTAAKAVTRTIEVGLHPSALALSPDGSRLYVANANSDSISVVDTARDAVESTIDVRPKKTERLGSAPNALAVSQDGRTLYVANGGNNAIAVVEPRSADPIKGFIPVGWFPAALALTNAGDRLLVGNGYGFGSIAPAADSSGRSYADRTGELSFLPVPVGDGTTEPVHGAGAQEQRDHRRRPVAGPRSRFERRGDSARERSRLADRTRYLHHQENRTYDQVFGDLPQGNGDPSLAIFGRTVTPNLHALAEQFVLLDNYYTAGDQSSLGHQWCDEAYANDYSHKYGNARNDFAGTNPMAFAPSGFIWDNARITARARGFSASSRTGR